MPDRDRDEKRELELEKYKLMMMIPPLGVHYQGSHSSQIANISVREASVRNFQNISTTAGIDGGSASDFYTWHLVLYAVPSIFTSLQP